MSQPDLTPPKPASEGLNPTPLAAVLSEVNTRLGRIEGALGRQKEICEACQRMIHTADHDLHSEKGVLARLATLEAGAAEVNRLRDRAFVTVKDAMVAGVSASVTAAAMYLLRLL